MSLSLKKRIATHFMIATAIIIGLVFGTVYFIVQKTVYQNLDTDLSFEANKHTKEIGFTNGIIHFINKGELQEAEHREVQVNPVFLQITDERGNLMDKSPNLKENALLFVQKRDIGSHFNTKLNNRAIRQIQIPIIQDNQTKGFIIAAMALDAPLMVLKNLRYTLFALFPLVLIVLFFISSFLAGRSIIPIVTIIKTTNNITKNNLSDRVDLPHNDDELFDLSSAINGLLDRIEFAIEREKQFTSDASHELRTPLSVLRGTLEILIRKPRSEEEYKEKITYSLTEIDRMSQILEQLLQIARFDSTFDKNTSETVSTSSLVESILQQYSKEITNKNLTITYSSIIPNVELPVFYGHLILDNLIGNAVKYSKKEGKITLSNKLSNQIFSFSIEDQGIGIQKEDMAYIFTPFFRSNALNHKEIKGNGLGLSIAQKAAKAIGAEISITSEYQKGTKATVNFKEILR